MRVGIDYWPATTHAPGVGRYVRELVRALVRRDDAPWLGLFDVGPLARVLSAEALGLEALGLERRGSTTAPRFHRCSLRLPHRIVELLPLAADRWLGGVDLFQRVFPHRPRIARAKQVLALAEIPAPGQAGHAELARAAARQDGVLVASQAGRAAACERLGLDPARVRVVPVGCEHWLRAQGGAARAEPDGPPLRLVVLGRTDRARAPLEILSAAGALHAGGRELELELVFAGRAGDAAGELRSALAAARVPARWLEAPSEPELARLVNGAAALVHVEREAFTAVTPLEALAGGAAVVATRLPAFDEALGPAAEWIAPEARGDELAAELARALERALASARDPAARTRRAALAAPYTWDRAAALTIAAWEQILARA